LGEVAEFLGVFAALGEGWPARLLLVRGVTNARQIAIIYAQLQQILPSSGDFPSARPS
jgi:hypothetical protein